MEQSITGQVIETLVILAVPAVVAIVGLLARAAVGLLRTRLTNEQFQLLTQVTGTVVAAVEQTGLNRTAAEKKIEAMDRIEAALAARGVNISFLEIEAAIEASVLRELNGGLPPQQGAPVFDDRCEDCEGDDRELC